MFFSIVVPVYNVMSYVRACLDSLRAQSFTDWECICINDGSTDNSATVLEEYAGKDPRIRVVHKANEGVSCARNRALALVRGEYIGFLDADDVIDIDWLKTAHDLIVRNSLDLLRMNVQFWRAGRECPKTSVDACECVVHEGQAILRCVWPVIARCGFSVVLFANREKMGDVRFPAELKMREDVIFGLSLLHQMSRVGLSNYNGYFYRMREDSACHTSRTRGDIVDFAWRFWSEYNECSTRCIDPMYSRMLWIVIREWVIYAMPADRSQFDGMVANAVLPYVRDKGFRLRFVELRWRFAAFWFWLFGSFWATSWTLWFLRIVARLRGKVRQP